MKCKNLAFVSSCLLLLGAESGVAASPSITAPSIITKAQQGAVSLDFKVPKRGAPTATAGGASRSSCVAGTTPLTILSPSGSIGLTSAARPTFFVYLPETVAKTAEFVIKDVNDNDVYRIRINLSQQPGIISLKLPETAPELRVDQYYRWYFAMVCRPSDRLEDVFASAWIQRIQPEQRLLQTLRTASKSQVPALYAEAGLWYDTLTTLAELRRTSPNDNSLSQDWTTLLQQAGLKPISNAPLVSSSS